MMAAAISLLLALTWGGVRFEWLSWQILALFAGSAMLWALFACAAGDRAGAVPAADRARQSDRAHARRSPAPAAWATLVGLTIFVPLYFETVIHCRPASPAWR